MNNTEHKGAPIVPTLKKLGAGFVYWAAPYIAFFLAFGAGASLLIAAAAPGLVATYRIVRLTAPLPIFEASHFTASIIGTLLVLISIGLWQRLRPAWAAAVGLLPIAAAVAVLFGAHYWYAAALSTILFLLILMRGAFDRPTALRDMRLSPLLLLFFAALFGGLVWFGFWNFRAVEYRQDLWWTFAFDGQASRFLRSIVTVFVVFALALAWRSLSPPKAPATAILTPELRERLKAVIASAEVGYADANLALLGDKRFVFSDSGRTFLMYGVQGRNWIVMGAPVGLKSEAVEVLWKFMEMCDVYRAQPVLFAFRADLLPEVLNLGLVARKIGESAILPLTDFSLDGKPRAKLRQAKSRGEREGCSFAILTPAETVARIDELEAISDAWLARHQGREKGFSLGAFNKAYLAGFSTAVIRRDETIVAFANLWTAQASRTLSIDLMRHANDAPPGVMDYLFTELALWGKAQGYRALDLGMTPLAGLDQRRLAPLVTRLGAVFYETGEALYGFEGLRRYKEKFHPVWESLYIAARSELGVGYGLLQVGLLTSGGVRAALR